jgi:hypothetical protein
VEKAHGARVQMAEIEKSYGICVAQFYSDIRHQNHQSNSVRDRFTQDSLVEDQMLWFLKKGDVILSDNPLVVEKPFAIRFAVNDSSRRRGRLSIFASSEDEPPDTYQTSIHGKYHS